MPDKSLSKERFLIEALRSLSSERKIKFQAFSHDWIVKLSRDDNVRYVYGYNFDLNPSAAALIANDKSALSDLLKQFDIPHVEHEFFLTPRFSTHLGADGSWLRAIQSAERFGYPLVCKGNQGTGGNKVFRVQDQSELEEAFQRIHTSERGLAMSPFYRIEAEFRMILLDGEDLLCYEKSQPFVVGDGFSSFFSLVQQSFHGDGPLLSSVLAEPTYPLGDVPAVDERVSLIWKHNLGKGARPVFDVPGDCRNEILKLAQKACHVTGIRFASVDVIRAGGDLRIMEINTGIMMERISRYSEEGRTLALTVYSKALELMF